MKPWKKIVLIGLSIGAGFALVSGALLAAFVWYDSRPAPVKPWDSKAISAEFDTIDASGDQDNYVEFYYTLQNNTGRDYYLPAGAKIMARLQRQKNLSAQPDGFEQPQTDLFIPANTRARYMIKIKYTYPEKPRVSPTTDESKQFQKRVAEYINKEMGNLDGFTVFDDLGRFQIDCPKGW